MESKDQKIKCQVEILLVGGLKLVNRLDTTTSAIPDIKRSLENSMSNPDPTGMVCIQGTVNCPLDFSVIPTRAVLAINVSVKELCGE